MGKDTTWAENKGDTISASGRFHPHQNYYSTRFLETFTAPVLVVGTVFLNQVSQHSTHVDVHNDDQHSRLLSNQYFSSRDKAAEV